MKTLFISLLVVALSAFTIAGSGLTKEEREMAVSELNASHDHLKIVLRNLSDAQLNFKSSEDSWSIAECVEHITISEHTFPEMLQGMLQTPADPSKRLEVKISDKGLIALLEDRTNKVKTQKPFEPTGKYGSFEETWAAFQTKRAENIAFVQTTEEDLRNRVQAFPFGTVDGLQVILFMSAHTERHVRQIEEVMRHQEFPEE